MRTTATPMQRRNTPIFSILLKWTFLLLILLASTVSTFSGELPMTKADPNQAAVPSNSACTPLGTYDLDHQKCVANSLYTKNSTFRADATLPSGCPTPSPNTIDVQVSPFIGTQCFYQGTCAAPYATTVGKFCIAYIGNHTPSTDKTKCPTDGVSETIRLYNNQVCFYLNTTSAACATKYTSNGPDCYYTANTGTPAGCAAPPQGISNINISRNNYTQQCFYFQQSAACSGSYSTQADQFCVGYVHGTQPTADTAGTCPKAPSDAGTIYIYGSNCFYLQTTICTDATYKFLAPSCLAINATNATKSATNTQCPDSTGTLSPDKSYCFVSAGTTTNCDSNTKYPYYSQANCYFFFSASTGNQDAVNGACTNSSFPYLSNGKCYSFVTTKNTLKSPSGTDGMPAVNGQCPAGPSGVTVDYDTTSKICYYAISGSTCTSPYQEDSTKTWCQAPPLDTFASTKSGLPPQSCPMIDGIRYVLKSDGNCAPPNDSSTADEISPTCASGYIYDSSTKACLANPVGSLTDTSDNCKLDTAKPPKNYVCTYTTAKAALTCTIVNQPPNGEIECFMRTGDANTGTVISHYVCDGVDTNYNPTKCWYYGNNSSKGTILAYSTCTTASSIVDCTIVTCIAGGTKPIYQESVDTTPPTCNTNVSKGGNDTYITATIDQNCSQFADGKPLTCTYGNSKSTKSREVHIICSSLSSCTVYDYAYSDQFARSCTAPTDNSPSICTITGPNNITWKESCTPYPPDQTLSSTCKIISPANNSTILGAFTCSALDTNPVNCGITDDSNNSMQFACNNTKGPAPIATCTATTPECPNHTTVTESTVACSAALIVDLLATPPTTGDVTLTFPLSQAELQFLLAAKELGISSQAWTSTTQNLPTVTYI